MIEVRTYNLQTFDIKSQTKNLAGGFFNGLFSVDTRTSSETTSEDAGGLVFAGAEAFFFGGSLAGAGAADLGGPPAPAFDLTVAFSYASFTFAFLTSARLSIRAFNGLSPTILIRVPKQTAASFRAPSTESSKRGARASVSGLICGGGTAIVDLERHLARNFNVPSFTWGFLELRAGSTSPRMSGRVVCK